MGGQDWEDKIGRTRLGLACSLACLVACLPARVDALLLAFLQALQGWRRHWSSGRSGDRLDFEMIQKHQTAWPVAFARMPGSIFCSRLVSCQVFPRRLATRSTLPRCCNKKLPFARAHHIPKQAAEVCQYRFVFQRVRSSQLLLFLQLGTQFSLSDDVQMINGARRPTCGTTNRSLVPTFHSAVFRRKNRPLQARHLRQASPRF